LLETYLNGQQLKSNTFPEGPVSGTSLPKSVDEPVGATAQVIPHTTVDQMKPHAGSDWLGYLVQPVAVKQDLKPSAVLMARQVWEGTVVSCQNGSFDAKVSDRTNPTNPDELVSFELDEISDDDRALVKPGSAFYWTIGTEKSPAGQIRNIEMVNFRRLPQWTKSTIEKADKSAKELSSILLSE
jgi:hypothetical protein